MFSDRKKFINRLKSLTIKEVLLWRWLPAFVWLSISAATLMLWKALADKDLTTRQHLVEFAAASVKQEVNTQMRNRFQALERIRQRWMIRGGTPQIEWEVDAQNYLRDYPGFQAIEWIDPDFYVRWIVPRAGNEAAQNLNLAFEPRRKAALEAARQKDTVTVTRTINLVQGGKGFLVYVPIFLNNNKIKETPDSQQNSFDGFILGVFRLQSLLDTLLDENVAPGYALAIADGGEEIYRRSFSENDRQTEIQWSQETEINFEGVTWQLRVWPTSGLVAAEQSLLPKFVLSVGLIMAILVALAVYLAQTAQRRTQQVEIINYKLTKEIVERQKTSSALQEQESTLRSFFHSSPFMMGIVELTDDDILHIAGNQATAVFFGVTPEAMNNQLASSFGMPAAQLRKWIQHSHESQTTGSPVHFEHPHKTESNTRWLSATVAPIIKTQGMRARFSYIVEDITVRKQAENILKQSKRELEILVAERTAALRQVNESLKQELKERLQAEANLRELERRWRTLLENVRLVVVGLNRDAQVEYANPFFLELTKYAQEEVVNQYWFHAFVPQSQLQQAEQTFQEILDEQFHPHYQHSILTKSGAEKIIAWNSTLLRNIKGEVNGIMSIGLDITERYAIEQMKDEFISVASHEMRTPLTSIHGVIQFLEAGRLGSLSPAGKEMINLALRNTERLISLLNDVLDLERMESGKEQIERQCCDSAELINQAIEIIHYMAQEHQTVIKTNSQSIKLWADPERILQTLTNLISNAIKFSAVGSTIWIMSQQENQKVLFTVKDQGRGIPPDKLESIFERFHQVDATDARKKGGTGLGLAICRSIVEQHGGRIWVESVYGQGSSFYFSLPIKVSEVKNT
ncbi:MAG: ATP-binding protein [Xenococcus sp. MO_188.B8]|nr:ATP-binding protein [Xenococcus sp. MO_188.B8]